MVVGTPGRMLDHLRRRSLNLSQVRGLVLDEADEMLRMGFIDDVETILAQTPDKCQRALFSATMPSAIRRVSQKYLGDAESVSIEGKTKTVEKIEQQYVTCKSHQKMDALTRVLEVESFDGMIIFVRTKSSTVDIAERLEARGFSSAALNGDLSQAIRERTINRLKKGQIDIVVATDVPGGVGIAVAARFDLVVVAADGVVGLRGAVYGVWGVLCVARVVCYVLYVVCRVSCIV